MSVIGVVSMKGGVGKTSITANLAAALGKRLGTGRVSVIDLDPQNALHWHFGLEGHDGEGICELASGPHDLSAIALTSEHGVTCLPYGTGDEPDREAFEATLIAQPDWIGHQIKRARLDEDAVVLIDTPPGSSVYMNQVLACADLLLIVVLADAGSYATIPAMESYLCEHSAQHSTPDSFYLLNQVDRHEPLNRDVADMLRRQLGDRLVPVGIHADQAVSDAMAFQQPVVVYDPHGQASHDVVRLASWVIDVLNR